MSRPYRFQSKCTSFYVTSTEDDADGQEIKTVDGRESIPLNTVLLLRLADAPVGHSAKALPELTSTPGVITIAGVTGLYVALESDEENTPLTWSKDPYKWVFKRAFAGGQTFYLIPANGSDLYWFDELNTPPVDIVIVKAGKNVKPPESEWIITPARAT